MLPPRRPGGGAGELYAAAPAAESAIRTIAVEQDGLAALHAALLGDLGEAVTRAVDALFAAKGRVIVSGIGKSGHVGQKLAATFASTGTPAFFFFCAQAASGMAMQPSPQGFSKHLSASPRLTAKLSC